LANANGSSGVESVVVAEDFDWRLDAERRDDVDEDEVDVGRGWDESSVCFDDDDVLPLDLSDEWEWFVDVVDFDLEDLITDEARK